MPICCECIWAKKNKITKLFNEGIVRIDKDLDMVKIIRNIRN
jgi:hypothetical protein